MSVMGVTREQQAPLDEWMVAAEALRDPAQELGGLDDDAQTRHLIKERLRDENRVRAANGYPPQMFNAGNE